jgi:hypothetical protein
MRIIRQLPSEDGKLNTVTIDNINHIQKFSNYLVVHNHEGHHIKDFRNMHALNTAYTLLMQPNIIELHLEYPQFFGEILYSNETVAKMKYMNLQLHMQRVLQDLIRHYKCRSVDLKTLYAFELLTMRDIELMLTGIIHFEITSEINHRWLTTLPIPKLATLDGVAKRQYYEIESNRLNSKRSMLKCM